MDAEKIICCDLGDNDNALAAAILANGNRRNDDPMAWAAMMNQNQQWNNPFAYLIWMMFASRFMGGWGEGLRCKAASRWPLSSLATRWAVYNPRCSYG